MPCALRDDQGGAHVKRQAVLQTAYDEVMRVDPDSHQIWSPAPPPLNSRFVPRLPGIAFMYTENTQRQYSPTALKVFVQRLGSLPDTVVIVTVRQASLPVMTEE
jgi:hypothetical protein